MEPNTRQRRAIASKRQNNVVIAGPGTGKSRVLLLRARHLLDQGAQPRDIVLCSFTNASIRDLALSIEKDEAYSGTEDCRLSTFHSLALRSLIRTDPEQPKIFIADDWEERFLIDPYLKSALHLTNVKQATRRRRDFDARWCQADENPEDWLGQADRLQFQTFFQRVKRALDFHTRGELTFRWWQMLTDEPAASNADLAIDFRHLLVDEYQDLNECEHQILEILGHRGIAIFVVGDPNQSIYETMRHAHPDLCESFPQRFQQTGEVTLDETYRCPDRVLDAATALMAADTGAAGVPTQSHRPMLGEFRIVNFVNESAEATGVAAAAKALAQSHPDERILILYPVKQVGQGVSNALSSMNQDHIFTGKAAAEWEPDEDRLGKALARLIGNPTDSLAAAAAVMLSGPKARRQELLTQMVTACAEQHKTVVELLGEYFSETPTVLSKALAAVRLRIDELREIPVEEAVISLETASGLENLDRYVLSAEQRRRVEQLAVQSEAQTLTEDDEGEDGNARLEELSPGITLTSFHGSKGLEADTVFLLAVEPDFFEDDTRSFPNEKRRLLFVGLTRSLNRLYASYASRRYGPGSYVSAGPHTNRRGPSDFITTMRERLDVEPEEGTRFVQAFTG